MRRKILLICGILSSVLYVGTDLLASWWDKDYSLLDQNYSELLATGAPTRPSVLLVSVVYNLLVAVFAVGVWTTASPKPAAHRTGGAIFSYAVLSMITPMFFQMDMRGAPVTPLGGLHPPMTAVMSVFILLSIGFGGYLLGRRFRMYSFVTIAALIIFGGLTALQVPQLEAGLSTPWMGLTERFNIYGTMLWFGLLSAMLLRIEGRQMAARNIKEGGL